MALILPAGTRFQIEGLEWEVLRGRGDTVTAKDLKGGTEERTFDLADLVQRLKSESLKIIEVPVGNDESKPAVILLSELPDRVISAVAWKHKIVKALEFGGHSKQGYRQILAFLAVEYREMPASDKERIKFPSLRTAQYWLALYRRAGRDVMALVPTLKRDASPRYDPRLLAIIDSAIDSVYMNPRSRRVKDVLDAVVREVRLFNEKTDTPIAIASDDAVYRKICRVIRERPPRHVMEAREGKRKAELVYGPVGDAPRPTRILERVELDHTLINRLACDHRNRILGKPTLTYCSDKYSNASLGHYLGFERHSAWAVLQCLRNAILPKDYVKKDYPRIVNDWNALGIPETLVIDNGKEMVGKNLAAACEQLGITLQFTREYRGQDKGAIERAFRTVKRMLEEGPDAPPIPIDKFSEYVHMALIDEYMQTPSDGVGGAPAALWDEQFRQRKDLIPPGLQPETIIVLLSKVEYRVPSKHGIELNYLFYNSNELQDLRAMNPGVKLPTRYDPDELGRIWVTEPETGRQLTVPCTRPWYADSLSLRAHQTIMRMAIEKYGKRDDWALREAQQRREAMIEEGPSDKRGRKEKGLTALEITEGRDFRGSRAGLASKGKADDRQPATAEELGIKLRPRSESGVAARVGRHRFGGGEISKEPR